VYGLYQIVYFTIIDILRMFKSPFFLLIISIIYYQYKKHTKRPLMATLNSLFFGAIGGIIATVAFLYLQVYLIPMDFIYILIVAIILSLIDTRFICFSYGGSLVVLSHLIFGFPQVDAYELMLLVAVLHMVEAVLIILSGNHQNSIAYFPINFEEVGGYVFNRIWPLTLVLFIGDTMIRPITVIALLSYGDFTVSYSPKRKTVLSGIILFFYGLILFKITLLKISPYLPPILAIIGHEFIIHLNKYRERTRVPLYTIPKRGIRVFHVKNNSIAKKLGISKGDIVLRINDLEVKEQKDLLDLERLKQDSYKIEFFNLKKGLVVKTYRGKRKNLGIVTLPKVL